LDEEIAEEDEVVEEATKLSDKVAKQPVTKDSPKDDNKDGMKMPAPTKVGNDVKAPVLNDGSDGNKGDSAKDHTPTDNINVDQKSV
jgi:hypothetical protein